MFGTLQLLTFCTSENYFYSFVLRKFMKIWLAYLYARLRYIQNYFQIAILHTDEEVPLFHHQIEG